MKLGRYLKGVREASGKTQKDVAARLKKSVPTISRLENDRLNLGPEDVERLARAYGVDALVLFSFLPPPVGRCAVLRRTAGFRPMRFTDKKGRRATYRTPVERLQGSDNFIVFLTLGKNGESRNPDHRHPGDEIVFVLRGKVLLHVGELAFELNQGDIAHFESTQDHYVENLADGETELLIVRQYGARPAPVPTGLKKTRRKR